MVTPNSRTGRGAALTNVPAAWWQDKKLVADRVGNALLISLTAPADVRRVVGLYQQRAASDAVQLKVASSKREGAVIRNVRLEEALDCAKWRLLPHFFESEYDVQGDTARATDTEDASGTITGVVAVLKMAGQPEGEPKVYPIQAFLSAWVPEAEAPEERSDPEESGEDEDDPEVDEPDQTAALEPFPKILAAMRGAEMVNLQ